MMPEIELPSASKLETAEKCMASVILPRNEIQRKDAADGTIRHKYIADRLNGNSADQALEGVRGKIIREECLAIDIEAIERLREGRTELAFAYNAAVNTGRILGQNINRRYREHGWIPADEYPASSDYCGWGPDKIFTIDDFKTGDGEVTRAQDNIQLAVAAVAAASVYGAERILVRIVRTSGAVLYDGFILEALHLDLLRDRLKQFRSAYLSAAQLYSEGTAPRPNPGTYCNFCPSYDFCPAQTVAIKRWIGAQKEWDTLAIPEIEDKIIANGDLAKSLESLQLASKFLSRVDIAMRNIAKRHGGIQTSDGKIWGPIEMSYTDIDPTIATDVIIDSYGGQIARVATEVSVTKASISRAADVASKIAGNGSAASISKNILQKIHDAGGLTHNPRIEYRKHDPNAG